LLSPFALFPEIDALFGMHRMILHNVFIVMIPVVLYLISRNLKNNILYEKRIIFILIAYFLLSHLILDLAYPGVALFYPLSGENAYFSIDFMFENYKVFLVVDYGFGHVVEPPEHHKGKLVGDLGIGFEYIKPNRSPKGELIGNPAVMVLALVLLFIAVQRLLRKESL